MQKPLMHLKIIFHNISKSKTKRNTRENKVTETHMIGPEEESSQILEVLRGLAVSLSSLFFQNLIEKLKNLRQFLFKKFFSCVQEKFLKVNNVLYYNPKKPEYFKLQQFISTVVMVICRQ